MKTLSKLTLASLALAVSSVSIADDTTSNPSVTGGIELEVKMPEVLILYHWDKANINYNDLLKAIKTGSGEGKYDLTTTNLSVEGNLDTSDTAGFPDTKVDVTLKNSWGVRSIVKENFKPKVSVGFVDDDSTLYLKGDKNNTNKITLSDTKLTESENTAVSIHLEPGWEAKTGDLSFKMDLSNATTAGSYKSATENKETFKLTLTSAKSEEEQPVMTTFGKADIWKTRTWYKDKDSTGGLGTWLFGAECTRHDGYYLLMKLDRGMQCNTLDNFVKDGLLTQEKVAKVKQEISKNNTWIEFRYRSYIITSNDSNIANVNVNTAYDNGHQNQVTEW